MNKRNTRNRWNSVQRVTPGPKASDDAVRAVVVFITIPAVLLASTAAMAYGMFTGKEVILTSSLVTLWNAMSLLLGFYIGSAKGNRAANTSVSAARAPQTSHSAPRRLIREKFPLVRPGGKCRTAVPRCHRCRKANR